MDRVPRIAIPSFPGSNGEVDNLRTLRRCGFDAFVFRWNDSHDKLQGVDGYFLGAGFSYEDRGRSGMVAARDPLLRFLHEEAARGAVIVGNCNGAQILVESGLVPLDGRLSMALAHNAIRVDDEWQSPGFLNTWVWITPACSADRCATSQWTGTLHIPIAHGEGRFATADRDLIKELASSQQLAFRYSDASGTTSDTPPITPNGSTLGVAGICNPAGNVVALMPHPERTPLGDPYFRSIHHWLRAHPPRESGNVSLPSSGSRQVPVRSPMTDEVFIDTIITNNEERTVEQAARRIAPSLRLRQFRYVGFPALYAERYLASLTHFNPHKEIAFVRRGGAFYTWQSEAKTLAPLPTSPFQTSTPLLRRNVPDTGASGCGAGAISGVLYACSGVQEQTLSDGALLEVFSNPHSSTLEKLAS